MKIKSQNCDYLSLTKVAKVLNFHQFVELVVKKIKSLKYKSHNWGSLYQVKALHPFTASIASIYSNYCKCQEMWAYLT